MFTLIIILDKIVPELYMYVKKREIISNIWLNYMSCLNRFELEQAHNEEIQKIEEKRYCCHYESNVTVLPIPKVCELKDLS